ncbi:MAG: hypothetical protein IT305_27550 [Chloroflexi bacterium]|nr:hypothetical protein [Chloroflexota bacterium]
MNGRESRLPPIAPASASVEDLCMVAITALDRALDRPSTEVDSQADVAERAVARLRDTLIETLRAQQTGSQPAGSSAPGDAAKTRSALDQVNVALSLIVGVVYPSGGPQRQLLEQARDSLRSTLSAGLR